MAWSRPKEHTLSTKKRIARNTLSMASVQMLNMLIGFVFMPLFVGHFGVTNYGVWLLVSSVTGYLALMDLGVGGSLVKYLAQYVADEDDHAVRQLVSTSLAFYMAVGVLGCLALLGVAVTAGSIFNLEPESLRLTQTLLYIAAFSQLVSWPLTTPSYILQGLQRHDLSARVNAISVVVSAVATGFILVNDLGPVTLLLTSLAITYVAAIVNFFFARRELGGMPFSIQAVTAGTLKTVFRYSWALFVMQIVSVVIYQQTDRVVLGIFASAAAITMYEAPAKLHTLVRQLSAMIGSAILPAASQLQSEGKTEQLKTLCLRGGKYGVAFAGPVVVGLMVLAKPIFIQWLGPEFGDQALAAQIFVSYWLVTASVGVAGGVLLGTSRLRFIVTYGVAVALANIALSVILVQRLGVLGVVIGSAVPQWVGFFVYLRYVLKTLDIPLKQWVDGVASRTYPLLVVTIGVALAFVGLGVTDTLLGCAFAGVVSVGAYWVCFYLWGLVPSERADVRAGLTAVRQRFTPKAV